MWIHACQATAHIQQVELPADRQILTTLAIELLLGYDGRYVNGHAMIQSKAAVAVPLPAHLNPEKAAFGSHNGCSQRQNEPQREGSRFCIVWWAQLDSNQ